MKKRSPKYKFTISINDGFVEYSFEFMLSGKHSIDLIKRKIIAVLETKPADEFIRK